MLGIVPDDPSRFPYYATEEHQEMIVVDLNCKDNLANLLNQVMWSNNTKIINHVLKLKFCELLL